MVAIWKNDITSQTPLTIVYM